MGFAAQNLVRKAPDESYYAALLFDYRFYMIAGDRTVLSEALPNDPFGERVALEALSPIPAGV
jgi:hypothetical protein